MHYETRLYFPEWKKKHNERADIRLVYDTFKVRVKIHEGDKESVEDEVFSELGLCEQQIIQAQKHFRKNSWLASKRVHYVRLGKEYRLFDFCPEEKMFNLYLEIKRLSELDIGKKGLPVRLATNLSNSKSPFYISSDNLNDILFTELLMSRQSIHVAPKYLRSLKKRVEP